MMFKFQLLHFTLIIWKDFCVCVDLFGKFAELAN